MTDEAMVRVKLARNLSERGDKIRPLVLVCCFRRGHEAARVVPTADGPVWWHKTTAKRNAAPDQPIEERFRGERRDITMNPAIPLASPSFPQTTSSRRGAPATCGRCRCKTCCNT